MADVDDKAPKAPEKTEDAHNTSGETRNTTTDRAEADRSKDTAGDPSSKLLMEISKVDWQSLGKTEFQKTAGREARSILSMNPLGDQSDKADKSKPGKDQGTAVLDREFKFDLTSKQLDFSGSTNPFDGGRQIKDHGDMGFSMSNLAAGAAEIGLGVYTPEQIASMGFNFAKSAANFGWDAMQGTRNSWDRFQNGLKDDGISNTGLSFGDTSVLNNLDFNKNGDLNLGSSLSTSFFDKANTDAAASAIAKGASSMWNSISDWGSKAWEGISNFGNAVIDFDFGGCKHETLTGKNGNMEMTSDKNGNKLFGTEQFNMSQSAGGKHDPKDAAISTKDGKLSIQHSADGSDLATNKTSDLSIKRNRETGKVEALDKSGNPVATFDDKGDAFRFFKNAVTEVVPPGTNLDQAYKDYQAKLDEEIKKDPSKAALKDMPVLLMDGKGESLTVQPDGTKLRTHPGGNTEMVMPHVDAKKESHPIEVRITRDAKGEEHFTIGEQGGKQYDLNSDEAKKIMADSRFKVGPDGQLQVNDDTSGRPERGKWNNLMDPHKKHHVRMWKGGDMDLGTGTATVTDGQTVAVLAPNKDGGVTDTEYKQHPDGTVDKHPSQVITTDGKGHSTIQAVDSTTGEVKKDQTIDVKTTPAGLEVTAWEDLLKLDPWAAHIFNTDGTDASIDKDGNLDITQDGLSMFQSDGDNVFYDGHQTYEQWLDNYTEEQAEDAINTATATAAIVNGLAAAIASSFNIDAGQIDALEQMLSGVVGNLPAGVPFPPQVASARASIAAARARDAADNSVDKNTQAIAGVSNQGLLKLAREAGTTDPHKAANYALKRAGYDVKSE